MLAVHIYDVRFYGFAPTPSSQVPVLISQAVANLDLLPEVEPRGAIGFRTRVLPPLVQFAAVSRGYKIPVLEQARLSAVEISGKGVRLRFSAGGISAPAVPDEDLLLTLEGARAFADAEELIANGRLAEAREAYLKRGDLQEAHPFAAERLLSLLVADPQAHDLALDVALSLGARRKRSAAALWAEAVVREHRGENARAAQRRISRRSSRSRPSTSCSASSRITYLRCKRWPGRRTSHWIARAPSAPTGESPPWLGIRRRPRMPMCSSAGCAPKRRTMSPVLAFIAKRRFGCRRKCPRRCTSSPSFATVPAITCGRSKPWTGCGRLLRHATRWTAWAERISWREKFGKKASSNSRTRGFASRTRWQFCPARRNPCITSAEWRKNWGGCRRRSRPTSGRSSWRATLRRMRRSAGPRTALTTRSPSCIGRAWAIRRGRGSILKRPCCSSRTTWRQSTSCCPTFEPLAARESWRRPWSEPLGRPRILPSGPRSGPKRGSCTGAGLGNLRRRNSCSRPPSSWTRAIALLSRECSRSRRLAGTAASSAVA